MPVNPLRRVLLVATFVSGIFVRTARAECLLPSVVTADVGVNVSEIQSKVLAPASATVLDDTGATCFTINVTATVTITQVYPELVYTQTGTHLGEYTVTLEAPAQAGSCYNSAINARSAGATATDSDGPRCWIERCDRSPDLCDKDWKENCPIVVRTGSGQWQFTGIEDTVFFDTDGDGDQERTTWTAAGSSIAFLARDLNGNGRIDDARELLGDKTLRRDGTTAANGFEALKELDDDGDGTVCHTDAAWSSLLLWEDLNHDGISDPGELVPISRSDILLLGTEYDYTPRLDANGNALRYRSFLRERHRTAPYYDVFFLSER